MQSSILNANPVFYFSQLCQLTFLAYTLIMCCIFSTLVTVCFLTIIALQVSFPFLITPSHFVELRLTSKAISVSCNSELLKYL